MMASVKFDFVFGDINYCENDYKKLRRLTTIERAHVRHSLGLRTRSRNGTLKLLTSFCATPRMKHESLKRHPDCPVNITGRKRESRPETETKLNVTVVYGKTDIKLFTRRNTVVLRLICTMILPYYC